MITRKIILVRSGQIPYPEVMFEIPYIREIRLLTVQNIRKYGRASLVLTLRVYIRSSKFLKNQYEDLIIKIKSKKNKADGTEREINKFLKKVSEYKHRIRKIKKKIKEEEKKL